jgi:integrase
MQDLQEPSVSRTESQGWGSGHVFRADRKSGPVWYAKYREPGGRQVQKKIGPAWSERGRPPAGYFTKRTAEAWLRERLEQARKGELPTSRSEGVTFAEAAREWLRYVEEDRAVKPSTLRNYRSSVEAHLAPAFGRRRIDEITATDIERWRARVSVSPRTKNKLLTELHGIFRRAQRLHGLATNPAADLEKLRERRKVELDVFTPEEVHALVRAATSEQDAAVFLTAAFTGLRKGELIALRWKDVDFGAHSIRVTQSYATGALTTPKSNKARTVPMAPEVAEALARLSARERWTSDGDLVFCGTLGGYQCGSALRRRYARALKRAGLRHLRFHDLRHTFGTRVIAKADILRVKEWMGHRDVQTTMRYLHYAPRPDDAALVAAAFASEGERVLELAV